MASDTYKTIKSTSEGQFRDRGSRFLAFAWHIEKQEEVKPILDALRKEYHDARHHCYAYMTGSDRQTWRVSDDGEPSGTAGRPILGQINSAELTNILIVVIRYFGGTLLGVSGLINAYRTAAAEAIRNAELVEHAVHDYYEISFPYLAMNDVMKVFKEENVQQSDQTFENECSVVIGIRNISKERILTRLLRVEGLRYRHLETR